MINDIWQANERASYNGIPPPCPQCETPAVRRISDVADTGHPRLCWMSAL